MVLEFCSSTESGRDTIVETEPGTSAPALNPVRLRGRVALALFCELLDQVWDEDWSPEK